VREWRSFLPSEWKQQDLGQVVSAMLTDAVTTSLPTAWQGHYSVARVRQWIEERDNEGTTLLVVDKSTKMPVGLMILFETDAENGDSGVEVRLGYLLSESEWGKGFASELVKGFVGWCRDQPSILSIAGGVARDNPASRRVLEKNGFQPIQPEGEAAQDEQLFEQLFRLKFPTQ